MFEYRMFKKKKIFIDKIEGLVKYNLHLMEVECGHSKRFELKGNKYRALNSQLIQGENEFEIFCVSDSKEHLSSSSLMRREAELLLSRAQEISNAKEIAENEVQIHVNRLIHNLVTLNASNLQEVYFTIDEHTIKNRQKGVSWKELITDSINSDPYSAGLSLVRIAKRCSQVKNEISLYNSIINGTIDTKIERHEVHRVLMSIFYVFFPDFTDNDVRVKISETKETALLDYETFNISLYYIIENITKYIRPGSQLDVNISRDSYSLKIEFSMVSLYLHPEEEIKIFMEGYSGIEAKKISKNGSGLGLFTAKKYLAKSNADVCLIAFRDVDFEEFCNRVYCRNKIIVSLSTSL